MTEIRTNNEKFAICHSSSHFVDNEGFNPIPIFSAPELKQFRVLVSKKFDAARYEKNEFQTCHERAEALPQASYKPLYCQSQVRIITMWISKHLGKFPQKVLWEKSNIWRQRYQIFGNGRNHSHW